MPSCFAAVGAVVCLTLGQSTFAHAPFDASARVIVHEDSAEIMITVGSALGENYLRLANINPAALAQGHPSPLNAGMATNFFTAAAGGKSLAPREADVVTEGQEFQFHFVCAMEPAKTLRLESYFTPGLKPPRAAPLVVTDENGNLLGSAILSPDKATVEFPLPERLFPPAAFSQIGTVAAAPAAAIRSLPEKPSTAATQPGFGEFLKLGIGHILTGYDHLLFLTALLVGCARLKPMLLVITGFTIAHSLTLALAALDVFTLPTRIVEPAIAASIIFVAADNFRRAEKSWQRYALTCGFGLIHGFGFAGALRATGLATRGVELVKPLFAFNLGVEMGQMTVAAVLLPILIVLRKQPWFQRVGVRVISAMIMLVAVAWLIERIAWTSA